MATKAWYRKILLFGFELWDDSFAETSSKRDNVRKNCDVHEIGKPSFNSFALIFGLCCLTPFVTFATTISIPDSSGTPGSTVEVPINVDDAAGIAGFQLTITFDENVLEATGAIDGSLTSGWSIVANTNTPAEIKISGLDNSLAGLAGGSGSLCIVQFNIKENTGTNRDSLDFTECKLRNNLAQEITTDCQSGSLRIFTPFSITKCTAKAGRRPKTDKITISGTIDISEADLINADQIHIVIESEDDGYEVCYESLTIDKSKIKKGKYTHKSKAGFSLKLDTIKGKFTLQGKNVNLKGLSCPLTLEIEVGNYFGEGIADEGVVNGPKKAIPIQFMSGYADTLRVDKIKAKKGKKASSDSLSVKGAFTLKDEPSDITSMTLSLGGQSLNIPGSAFSYKKTTVSCKNYDTGSGLVTAKFDTAKCKFIVTIKKAKLEETSGETTFGVLIDMSLSDSDYNESVPVNWP